MADTKKQQLTQTLLNGLNNYDIEKGSGAFVPLPFLRLESHWLVKCSVECLLHQKTPLNERGFPYFIDFLFHLGELFHTFLNALFFIIVIDQMATQVVFIGR